MLKYITDIALNCENCVFVVFIHHPPQYMAIKKYVVHFYNKYFFLNILKKYYLLTSSFNWCRR